MLFGKEASLGNLSFDRFSPCFPPSFKCQIVQGNEKDNYSSEWLDGWICKPSNWWHWSPLTCHLGNIGQNFHLRPTYPPHPPCMKEHSRMTASQPHTRTFWVLGMSVWRWARIERADFVGLRGAQYISSLLRSQLRKQHSSTMPVWGALRMLEP